ncbi:hypothetical protein GCM10027047_24640 [Rhodococcus aerolatus]
MSPADPPADLAVVGAGPAGRSLAASAAGLGLTVVLVDPAPHRRWTSTYGAFTAELDPGVPVAARVEHPVVRTAAGGDAPAPGAYAVLDVPALQDGLRLDAVRVVAARATALRPDGVSTADGTEVPARVVVDARGAGTRGRTVQTAHGVVVTTAQAAPLLDGAAGLFMDWRPDHGRGTAAAPTFCYAVPLGGDEVLLEETSLAGPGLPGAELRSRLAARLQRRGVVLTGGERTERVRFALDTPLPRREWLGAAPAVVRFGAAAPLVHPATGYSVAAALGLAPRLAELVAAGAGAADLHRVLWSARARAVHALRLRGLRALVGFDAAETDAFFHAFFALDPDRQRAYLLGRTDPAGTAGAMTALLPHLDGRMRRRLVGAAAVPGL